MTGTGQPNSDSPRDAAERRLAALLRAIPIIVYTAEAGGVRTTWVSPNIEGVMAFPPERFLEEPGFWASRLHPDDRERVLQARQQIAETGAVATEYRWQWADGTYRWFLDQAGLVRDEAGRPREIVGTCLDITDRKRAEEEVRQAREEAEGAARARTEFLSRASHELRTPLNAILGFAQLLEMEPLTPPQQESVAEILKGGRRLLDLIGEVLDITRIDAGRIHFSIEAVGVRDLLRETLDLVRPLAAQRGVRLPAGGEEDLDRFVLADARRLKQVLLNLLTNAVLYNREGGSVGVGCEPAAEECVRITVRDTGPGIPPEKLPRLFAPFDRLGAEETGVEGTGLGLPLSKRLVEGMGGTLGVESMVGAGSTFWVQLPATEDPGRALDRQAAPAAGPEGMPGGRRTLLYIEDNLVNLKLVERLLRARPGVKLLAAMQAGLGLLLAREHRPGLILLDVHLPDIPGEEVLRRLREAPETRAIPVVILSSDDSPTRRDRLLAGGARACLPKPLDVRRMLELLDDVLTEGAA